MALTTIYGNDRRMRDDIVPLQKQLIASLPNYIKWQFRETWTSYDFSPLGRSLLPVTKEPVLGQMP